MPPSHVVRGERDAQPNAWPNVEDNDKPRHLLPSNQMSRVPPFNLLAYPSPTSSMEFQSSTWPSVADIDQPPSQETASPFPPNQTSRVPKLPPSRNPIVRSTPASSMEIQPNARQ